MFVAAGEVVAAVSGRTWDALRQGTDLRPARHDADRLDIRRGEEGDQHRHAARGHVCPAAAVSLVLVGRLRPGRLDRVERERHGEVDRRAPERRRGRRPASVFRERPAHDVDAARVVHDGPESRGAGGAPCRVAADAGPLPRVRPRLLGVRLPPPLRRRARRRGRRHVLAPGAGARGEAGVRHPHQLRHQPLERVVVHDPGRVPRRRRARLEPAVARSGQAGGRTAASGARARREGPASGYQAQPATREVRGHLRQHPVWRCDGDGRERRARAEASAQSGHGGRPLALAHRHVRTDVAAAVPVVRRRPCAVRPRSRRAT